MIGCVGYMRHGHEPEALRKVVRKAGRVLRAMRNSTPFDAIAFRGMSGASIAYPVSYLTGIPTVNVRKDGGSGSHGMAIEGPNKSIESYVILDDLIDSGETVKAIIRGLANRMIPAKQCKAIVLYHSHRNDSFSYYDADADAGGNFVEIPVVSIRL